ncbi:MAG: DUF4347 domain-containing protein [Oscillatoria sp. SIO1A7]|nr:DUF4347 domain-containing protein [Oscillatoria sp. SIO1A7]
MGCIEDRDRTTKEIAFIDPSLEAIEILATGVKKGIEVIILDPVRDAIEQITAALAERSLVEAVHIICHGSPGALHLGETSINARDLDRYAPLFQNVGRGGSVGSVGSVGRIFTSDTPVRAERSRSPQSDSDTPVRAERSRSPQSDSDTPVRAERSRSPQSDSDTPVRAERSRSPHTSHTSHTSHTPPFPNLILYACQVAAGEIGRTFLEKLHQLTGANIAASSSSVGNPQLGGNWELDAIFAKVAVETALTASAMAAYPAVLSPSFGTQTTFGAGNGPRSVGVGDFNGDNIPDLAVANENDENVSVLLGDGSGSFGTQTTFGAGDLPYSVGVGDFNGDNIPDLAVANRNANVSVLLGDGSGSFGTQTTFGAGNGSFSVGVGDFNGDNIPDLAVANYSDDNVSVLLADGSGSFGTQTTFGAGNRPFSVGVGDFNGDNIPDLAVANVLGNNVSVLLADGSGSFGTQITFGAGNGPFSVGVGDFNGDNIPDLAVANVLGNNVSVLLADGSGSFGTQTTFGAGNRPSSVGVGDFNGDNIPDLAVANENDANVSVLLGDGSGSFGTQTTFGAGNRPFSVGVGDFNGDNIPDLAVANYSDDNVSVLLNTVIVSIAPGTTPTEAGPTNGNFAITLDEPAPTGGLTVNFNVTGSATDPADYSLTAGTNITGVTATTFTIAAGVTSATLNVVPIDDSEIETGGETVNINLVAGSGYFASTTANSAVVTITDDDFSEIDVEESGTSIADAGSFDFGSTVQGSNPVKTFTIANSGNADLTLGAETLTGTGYSLVGSFPTANIAAGGSTTFQIQLDASNPGTFNGNLSFVNNDTDENPYNFSLTGEITAAPEPEIAVSDGATNIADGSTTVLDFGSTLVGTPNSSANLEVQLDASAEGSFNGDISFDNNDADENSFNFAIGGTVGSNNPPIVANSVFSQGSGSHRSGQFSFAADSYVDPDPGDSITYSLAVADTWSYSWYDWAQGTNGGWYRKPKEGIVFPEVPIPSWLDFDSATRTLKIDEATRPDRFFYGVQVTGTDRSGASVSELFPIVSSTLGGFIIDNYIAGATVFWDANKNGIQDASEPSTTSDQTGEFDLNISIEDYDTNNNGILDPEEGQIVAVGGIDTATGLPLETPVVAAPESTVVTLLTTLVADLINKGLNVNEANERVVAALSLPPEVDINSLDPIAATENNEPGGTETLAAMVKVQNAITQTANLLDGASTADFNAIVSNVVGAITSQIQAGGTLDVSNSATLETIINSAAGATQQNDPNIDLTQVQAIASGAAQVMAASNQQIDTLVASGASGATLTAETANIQKVTLGDVTEELQAAAEGTKDIALVVAQNTGAALQAKVNTPGLTFASPVSIDTPPRPSLPTLLANIELVRNDATEGTDSDDTYIGDSSDNSYLGRSGNDILSGNGGNDWMNGNRGDDSLDGGEGNDTLYGGKDNDTISGNNGADVIFGNRGSDRLLGNNGDDFLNGNQGEDILFGGNGNDLLYGGKENDTLNGGDGSDTLSGDLGNDILTGGNGSDRFVLKAGGGSDILTDFEDGQDFLALADGLTFGQLAIAGENGSTLIRFEDEILATLQNVDASLISSADFVAFS